MAAEQGPPARGCVGARAGKKKSGRCVASHKTTKTRRKKTHLGAVVVDENGALGADARDLARVLAELAPVLDPRRLGARAKGGGPAAGEEGSRARPLLLGRCCGAAQLLLRLLKGLHVWLVRGL